MRVRSAITCVCTAFDLISDYHKYSYLRFRSGMLVPEVWMLVAINSIHYVCGRCHGAEP